MVRHHVGRNFRFPGRFPLWRLISIPRGIGHGVSGGCWPCFLCHTGKWAVLPGADPADSDSGIAYLGEVGYRRRPIMGPSFSVPSGAQNGFNLMLGLGIDINSPAEKHYPGFFLSARFFRRAGGLNHSRCSGPPFAGLVLDQGASTNIPRNRGSR